LVQTVEWSLMVSLQDVVMGLWVPGTSICTCLQ
jgi:hypothetical protein